MFTLFKHKIIIMVKEKLLHEKIAEQIVIALDGRTKRWLSFEIRVAEQDLSRKFKGTNDWKDEELEKIQSVLNFTLTK